MDTHSDVPRIFFFRGDVREERGTFRERFLGLLASEQPTFIILLNSTFILTAVVNLQLDPIH